MSATSARPQNLNGRCIVGAQWGDEGKGKIVDVLAEQADVVVRYQGGNNAGHTIVRNGETFKLHLLPSGVVWGKRSLIGAGLVIDPKSLLDEMQQTEQKGIQLQNLLGIDPRAHVVFPWHILLDGAREQKRSGGRIGTTGRGIGPAYEDKYARTGLRIEDLVSDKLPERLASLYEEKRTLLEKLYQVKTLPPLAQITDTYQALGKELAPYVVDVAEEVDHALAAGKQIIFEGAQGVMLDCSLGTYPFVTSSHPIAAGVGIGVGVGIAAFSAIEGVAKAYTTRVGGGPFPTELVLQPTTPDENYNLNAMKERESHATEDSFLGEYLRRQGFEFGTTTGRPRRTGWFDAVVLRTGVRWNSFTGIHITKLDVLGGLETVQICTAYKVGGKTFATVPARSDDLAAAVPQYESMNGFEDLGYEGWKAVVQEGKEKGFDALPQRALEYIKAIEQYVGVPVQSVSVGPERDAIIWR